MNIDQMPAGREMDALVAEKVMGWTPSLSSQGIMWLNKDGEYERGEHTFHPSTDIAAAWEVVERLEAIGVLLWKLGREDHMPNWYVSVGRNFQPGVSAEERTAPLAICRAALKAVSK